MIIVMMPERKNTTTTELTMENQWIWVSCKYQVHRYQVHKQYTIIKFTSTKFTSIEYTSIEYTSTKCKRTQLKYLHIQVHVPTGSPLHFTLLPLKRNGE